MPTLHPKKQQDFMQAGRIILSPPKFGLTLDRLCWQLLERHDRHENCCIVGIQSRGALLAERLYQRLQKLEPSFSWPFGKLDITFYRDDFRQREAPLEAHTTEMDFLVEGRRVILVDDVLYTGRTVQAALMGLQHYGRPDQVELLALVDRRFNRHLPIQCDYTGIQVDALEEAYVRVDWAENGKEGIIRLFANKEEAEK